MFSDYASRLIHQSQMRLSQHNKPKPLFQSHAGDREDIRESLALRHSRAGIAGRFGDFLADLNAEEAEQSDEEDDSAMRSSWRPEQATKYPPRQAPPIESDGSEIHSVNESLDDSDHDEPSHSRAPTDIMYGVSLSDSVPRMTFAPSTKPVEELEDSIEAAIALPGAIATPGSSSIHHDSTFSALFMLAQAASFSTSIFVYLRTDTPSSTPLADSVYSALTSSAGTILRVAFFAILVSAIWLVAVRTFVKPLFYSTIVAVPIISITFSLYTLVWSYKGSYGGYELQARAMRWSSLMLIIFAGCWIYTASRRRHTLNKAIDIIKLACTIMNDNLLLVGISLASLLAFSFYTLIWIHQFERIFLRGALSGTADTVRWLVRGDSWFLGACLAFLYLWTFGVVSGFQRASTSAVVSHWYFHRHDLPKIEAQVITEAACTHALTTSFGSICGSSLIALLTRIPLLVLPRRVAGFLGLFAYMLFSAPITNLTNPLTLTFATIHSISIFEASRGMTKHQALSPTGSQLPYRTAKMMLGAARATTALALGTIAWIGAARSSSESGSLYAYTVGLIAAMTAWSIVGSVESIVSVVVDAGLVCYSIDLPGAREGRDHCTAAMVFRPSSIRQEV